VTRAERGAQTARGAAEPGVCIELGDWPRLQSRCIPLRFAVFVEEQGVPADIELDAFDPVSLHAIAIADDGQVLATGRLLPDGHIGRLAVARSARGRGIGSTILLRLMAEASRHGHRETVLNAQMHAVAFYAAHGYRVSSTPFDDGGIAHVEMRAPATPVQDEGSLARGSPRD